MKKNSLIIFLFLVCIAASFLLRKIFGTYSHSMLQESKYPFYLREILAKNMPTCGDYKSISDSKNKLGLKILNEHNQGRVVMVTTAQKTEDGIKLLVSIINARHEQYFGEVFFVAHSDYANNHMHSDSKEHRSFLVLLIAAGPLCQCQCE